jgi:hypothetical protein
MKDLKVNKKVKSANGLFLQEMDVVEIGGNKYLALLEGKKLVVKRYDEKEDKYKYLYTWTGQETIIRNASAAQLLEVMKANEWLRVTRSI